MPRHWGGDGGGVVREVEVKYQVRDTDRLLAGLAAQGVELSEPVYQDDQAYAPVDWCYGDSKLGVAFVRLRTVAGRHTFTLKRPVENAMSCHENECQVSDRAQMHEAVLAMGFYPTVRIEKVRRTATVDTEIRGREIKAGDRVVIWHISANRDEEVWDDPFVFDITRNPNPHVAFGGGGSHF